MDIHPLLITLITIFSVLTLITLFVLALIFSHAVFTIKYTSKGLVMTARILFVKIKLYPRKEHRWHRKSMSRRRAQRLKKKLAAQEAKKKKNQGIKSLKKGGEETEKKGKITSAEILDILKLVIALVKKLRDKFFKHLKIKLARIKITVAGEDAAATAIIYGGVTQAINILLPLLEDIKNFSFPTGKNFDIRPDFTTDKSYFELKLSFSIRIVHILIFAIHTLIEALKYFFIQKERKEAKAPGNSNTQQKNRKSSINTNKKSTPSKKGI